jgi:alpha-tubulin suppressor-like RCC1 family protein
MSWSRQTFNSFKRAFSSSTNNSNKYFYGAMLALPAYSLVTPASLLSFSAFSAKDDDEERNTKRRPSYFWGNNLYGLADPSTYGKEEAVRYPRKVSCWNHIEIRDIAFSDKHAAAIDANGDVYQWGESFWQRSGIFGVFNPVCTLKGRNCVAVRANPGGVYVIDGDGSVLALDLDVSKTSQQVVLSGAIRGERAVDIQAGMCHLIALSSSGTVYTAATNQFGNIFGQLGRGPTDSTRRAIDQIQKQDSTLIPLPDSIKAIIQKWPHETKVAQDEAVTNVANVAQSVDARFPDITLEPVDTKWLNPGGRPVQIAAGDHHSLVLGESGHVFGFGSNEMLQLGMGDYDPNRAINPYPVEIMKPSQSCPERCTSIAVGGETSYFVMDSPTHTKVLAAGFGQYGQLGNKAWTHACGHPTLVHTISSLSHFDEQKRTVEPIRCLYLTSGQHHSAAVMNTFTSSTILARYGYDVYVWGNNKVWQLGLANKRNNVNEPVSIEPPDPIKEDVDYTDLALSKSGPTAGNPEETLTYVGGQLQILPTKDGKGPLQRIHCGRDVTVIY